MINNHYKFYQFKKNPPLGGFFLYYIKQYFCKINDDT